jgi:hypothetical protein
MQTSFLVRFALIRFTFVTQLYASLVGEVGDRFGKGQTFEQHQKTNGITASSAAKTMKEAALRIDVEGWGLFRMERTAGFEGATCAA